MGKALKSLVRNVMDVEGLRAFNMGLLQGMLDAGFVQTSDTGQMTSATASGGAAGETSYAVFRFDDALQATAPIFFRVDFHVAANASGSTTLTVGRGSDGAGGIVSPFFTALPFGVGATQSSSSTTDPYDYLFSSGPGYAVLQGAVNDYRTSTGTPYQKMGFVLERSRDHAGAITGDGFLVALQSNLAISNTATFTTLSGVQDVRAVNYATGTYVAGAAPVVANASINGNTPGPSTSLAAGSIGPVFPWDVVAPGVAPWRSCVVVSILAGDMPGGVFQTNLCGQVGYFYPIPASVSHNRWGVSIVGGTPQQWFGAGIRWED